MFPGTFFLPAGLLITGWTARASVPWIVPDIGIVLVGAGMILNFQSIQTYVIDTFTLHAASGTSHGSASPAACPLRVETDIDFASAALAAVTFLRSLAGFGFPLFAPAMFDKLGYGIGNTILAAVAFVVGCPAYVRIVRSKRQCTNLTPFFLSESGYSGSMANRSVG